jgi:GNAT superfamily N-acetyltransferase
VIRSDFPSLADYSREELIFMADEHDDMAFAAMLSNHQEMVVEGNFYQFLTGVMNPFANMLFGMEVPQAEQRVKEVTAWLTEKEAPSFWWVGPCTQPANLEQMLQSNGWIEGSPAPAMVIELAKLSVEVPKGLELREVRNWDELVAWQTTFSKGYELPSEVGKLIAPTIGPAMRLFMAVIDDQPVGTTGVFLHKGVPGIYCVSTIREYRGRGIGAAITALPLLEVREQGYRLGTLQASSMGHPVYKKLGFEDVCYLRVFSMNL